MVLCAWSFCSATHTRRALPRSPQDMMEMLARPEHHHLHLWLSFFEIYAGKCYDLLKERKKMPVREDGKGAVVVVGLTEHEVREILPHPPLPTGPHRTKLLYDENRWRQNRGVGFISSDSISSSSSRCSAWTT